MSGGNGVNGFFEKEGKYYVIKDDSHSYEESSREFVEKLEIYNPIMGIYQHKVTGENVFPFNYGPSTGGMVETVDFKIYTYGERILSVDILPEFKKRKIQVSGSKFDEAILKIERFNGFHSFSYSTLMVREIEAKLGINVDAEVIKARITLLETERIISHIFKTARLCESASQNVAAHWLFSLREELMRTVATLTGHRYMFGVNRVGGLRRTFDYRKVIESVNSINMQYQKILDGLFVSRIFIDRIENTCIVGEEFCRGPTLRATGIPYDYRMMDPYYGKLNFEVVTEDGKDSLARFLVFSSEVSQSVNILNQFSNSDSFEISELGSVENGSGGIETPSGDARIVLEIHKDSISAIHIRTPSMLNMEAFARGISGNVKTDIPFAFESFGIWICEMGDVV